MARWEALDRIQRAGVPVFVSMSPTYPTMDEDDFYELLSYFRALGEVVVFHEPINPRGGNFEMTVEAARDAGETELAEKLDSLRSRDQWIEYATNHLRWVQEIGRELDLPVHLWPDKQLIKHVSEEKAVWLQSWRDRQSVEEFADRKTPSETVPTYPEHKMGDI
jgi:DNA repair photolyase